MIVKDDAVDSLSSTQTLGRRAFVRSLAGSAVASLGGAALLAPEAQAQSGAPMAAFFVVDYYSRKVLIAGNHTQKRPVASLSKVATTCLLLDWSLATGSSLDSEAVVPPSAAGLSPNPFNFQPGDRITLRNALYCAMMGSDNIAAETLAWHVGQDLINRTRRGTDPYAVFVRNLNMLAAKLNMGRTTFVNPHGLDGPKGTNMSSAEDLARLSIYALQHAPFHFYMSQRQRQVTYRKASGASTSYLLKNTNQLVGSNGVDGMKTGTTERAGQCLILTSTRKNTVTNLGPKNTVVTPHRLIAVALACQDRFRDSAALMLQGWGAYDQWTSSGKPVTSKNDLLDGGPAPAPAPR